MELKFEEVKNEKAEVKLTITVDKAELQAEYKKVLVEAQKGIEMKGFRKGKVPASIIEMKYKKALIGEASHKVIETAYTEVWPKLQNKPIATSTPTLDESVFESTLDADLVFVMTYETLPEFTIGSYKGIEVEKKECAVTDADLNDELDRMLTEFSTIESKDTAIEENDIVLVEYKVFDGKEEVESKENEYVHIGKEYDKYKLSDDLKGLKKDDEKEISKTHEEKKLKIALKIKDVKFQKKPELTDELAKQIDKTSNTAEELKTNLMSNMKDYAEKTVKTQATNLIIDEITKTFEGVLPQSLIDAQVNSYYQELVKRAGGDEKKALAMLKKEGDTKESYLEKHTEDAVKSIKRGLILNRVIETEKIEASEDDVKAFVAQFSKYYNIDADELFENYKKNNQLDMFKEDVCLEKATDFLFDNAKFKKTVKCAFKDLEA